MAVSLPSAGQGRTNDEDHLVGALRLDFRERRDRARDELAAGVQAMFTRKQAVDRRIDDARDRLSAAVERQNAIRARWINLDQRRRATRTALERLQRAERGLPQQGVEGHRAVVDQIGRRIARLEGTIAARTRAGAGTAVHTRQLARQRRALADVEQGIVERGPAGTRDLRRRWLALQRDTHELLFDLHIDNAAAESARTEALDELTALVRERSELDEQAYAAALRLSSLDFDLRELRVRANGREVFRAVGSTDQFEKLQRFRTDIELAKQAEAALRPEFDRVRHAFYAAQREVIAAEADLAARLDYLAAARFTTDLAFAFLDVAMAYGSGGPVGAVTELVKKAAETQLSVTAGSGYEPGSIEAEVNARYRAELKDTFSAPQLMKAGMERVAKETLTKPAKDALNRSLAQALFGPLGHRLQDAPTDIAGRPLNATSLRALIRAPERLAHTDQQIEKLRKSGTSLRSLGLTMLKDVAKLAAKSSLDDYEREAWITFFERDMYARARYAIYEVARDLYAQAEDTRIWNEQRMLVFAEPGVSVLTGFTETATSAFDGKAQLELDLRVATDLAPEALVLSLVVGGTRLEPVARRREGDDVFLTYRVGAGGLQKYYSGSAWRVDIEVR